MNRVILSLSLLFTTGLFGFDGATFQVEKTFSDRKIKKLEIKMSQEFGTKVAVKVISRNARKEITNLEFVRYRPDGSMTVSCSSDKFGLLIVSKTGCRIADVGHEADINMVGK
ncbi:hypothetical protein [Fibrivirga algicola]|uniref:Uncharacterized protein n=1 Tax=Fibrivirga algicola TaxID=2950420 RepID=A0ABX0QN29_9BACT|nr:hypothetical protein [Fibrivirga algicola]NID13744.1 hypothetical protein [Fibrivirga algicola]